MQKRRAAVAIAATTSFIVSFAVYLRTLTPTVAFIDSGELTLAAAKWGVPHPPGFPLWVFVTHWFTLLPWHTVAWRANFASAVYASAAAALMAVCVAEILDDLPPQRLAIAATFAGLLLAFARTLWAYATLTEVYTLNVAMMLAVFACVLHWRRVRRDGWLYAGALLFGLALGDHHVTIGLTLPAIVFLVRRTKQLVICGVIATAATALIYAYEPIASSHHPPLDWGNTATAQGFYDHITGKQYRHQIKFDRVGDQLSFGVSLLSRELGPPWFPVALLAALYGMVTMWRTSRELFWFLILVIAGSVAWAVGYPIYDDQDSYFLATIIALVMFATAGALRLRAFALLIPLIACAAAYHDRNRSDFWMARRYVENALRPVAPNGVLLTSDWNLMSPLMYLQNVEGVRPDVTVLSPGWLQFPWYLNALDPHLGAWIRPQLDAFRTSFGQPDYATRYNDVVETAVNAAIAQGRAVYATRDYFIADEASGLAPSEHALESRYDLMPLGLVTEYVPRGTVRHLPPMQLDLRGVAAIDPRIIDQYARAYRLRGRTLFLLGQGDEAYASYRAAMDLQPDNPEIAQEMAFFAAKQLH